MKNYWANRLDEQNTLFDQIEKETDDIVRQLYINVLNDLLKDVRLLYADIEANNEKGIVRISDLYKNDRYYKLANTLNSKLVKLGSKEIEIYNEKFLKMYEEEKELLTVDNYIPDNNAQEVVNEIWTPDGIPWSQRVWANQEGLQMRVMTEITNCFSRGVSVNRAAANLAEEFNVSIHNAERLVRTELSRVQNQSALNRYKQAGIKKYKVIGAHDEKTCSEKCEAIIGKEFNIDDANVGTTLPPFHPNCRCGIVPVIRY